MTLHPIPSSRIWLRVAEWIAAGTPLGVCCGEICAVEWEDIGRFAVSISPAGPGEWVRAMVIPCEAGTYEIPAELFSVETPEGEDDLGA